MKSKRIISTLVLGIMMLSIIIAISGCVTEQSIIIPEAQQDIYVYDQDDCINDEIEVEINSMIRELKQKTHAEFAIVSISSLNGYTIEEYANELFNTLEIGKQGSDNGVLLLFSKSDERVRLEIGRGLEGCLNDAKCGRILDDYFVPYRAEGDYTKATRTTVVAVLNVIADEYQIKFDGVETVEEAKQKGNGKSIGINIIILIIVIIIVCLKASEKSESSGTSYRGGFPGGSSSRGGGFGGGRSGGGGASR